MNNSNTHKNESDVLPTRRDFIKTSTAAFAGSIIAAPFISSSARAQANADTIKIGLVGCGGRGSGAALNALMADPNVVLVSLGDAFAEPMQKCLDELKKNAEVSARVQVAPEKCFTGLDAYQKVIDSGISVVLLATPPAFRPSHIKAAVAAGKHIFAEKPMATDAPGVRSVLESVKAAKEKKLAVVAGFMWRYEPGRREFFKRVHDGEIGDIRHVHATFMGGPVKPMPPASERPAGMGDLEWQLGKNRWFNFVWTSGDGLVEQACHSVDKIMWAFKDKPPVKCMANGGRMAPNNEGNIYDHMDVFYEWENGARATMVQRQIAGCENDNSDYLNGTKGNGTIKNFGSPLLRGFDGGSSWRFSGEKVNPYLVEHAELYASIRKGQPINDGDWMANSTLAAIMGRMAAYTGQEVTWEDALESEWKLVPDQLSWDMKLPIEPIARPGVTKFI